MSVEPPGWMSANQVTLVDLPAQEIKAPREASLAQNPGWSVPLFIQQHTASHEAEPISIGVPFPKGLLVDPGVAALFDENEREIPLQVQTLNRWSDGSIKWLLLDFLVNGLAPGNRRWLLKEKPEKQQRPCSEELHVYETENGIAVNTGVATFRLSCRFFQPFDQVLVKGHNLLDGRATRTLLTDSRHRMARARINQVVLEEKGCTRATIRFEASFRGSVRARLLARLSFFAGTGLVRCQLTLHNPNRARHRGGLWDLGDPNSMLFRELALEMSLQDCAAQRLRWTTERNSDPSDTETGPLEIYQESSGGPNWQSRNHVSRHGKVPLTFQGYRVRAEGAEEFALRASPVLALRGSAGGVTVAMPEFWQQFPKALKVDGRLIRVGLFPGQFEDGFELQGGERKTHTLWMDFGAGDQLPWPGLDWVHEPAKVLAAPEWYAASGAVWPFSAGSDARPDRLDEFLAEVTQGPKSLVQRREIADEFGWRNFGEWYADHESKYYEGQQPVISHYNNQYDCLLGALIHYLQSGDSPWWQVADPLARHVIDIDRYHTTKDKAGYNGGLFWHTDHYHSAGTCTHRTYSRANCPLDGQSYGGGPSSSHNYTSGLLLYFFLTGNPEAKAAVQGLADWVIAMDDGRNNPLGILDDGPTGLASATGDLDYQGPGRGSGNSINALLDGWLLTEQRRYLDKADALIRRCIHPKDDIMALDLLDIEKRWSYTVFLTVLDRYLRIKAEMGVLDAMYTYAQQSLLAYASWMLVHELPYFEQRERMEFPTEVWASQEFRKANVLRLAAAHADELLRSSLMRRGQELAERGWRDLLSFESFANTRVVALMLVQGLLDRSLRTGVVVPAPRGDSTLEHSAREAFVPQKRRVLRRLKTASGQASALLHLLNPWRWLSVSWRS